MGGSQCLPNVVLDVLLLAQAQVASASAVEEWPELLQMGTPPPPLPAYMPPSALDDAAASLFF